MCQARVYLGGQEIAQDVIWLEPVSDGVRLETFFEGSRLVKGRIQHIDFLNHRVLLEPLEVAHGRDRETESVAAALD